MICFRIWSLFARPCILGWAWRRVRRRSCPCRSRPRSAALFARRTWSAAWWWSWWRLMVTSVWWMDDVRVTITSQLVGQRWRFRFPSHKWRCLRQSCKIVADRRSIFYDIDSKTLRVHWSWTTCDQGSLLVKVLGDAIQSWQVNDAQAKTFEKKHEIVLREGWYFHQRYKQ